MTEVKNERKKVTLASLIEKKMKLKENINRKATGTLYIPSLDGDIEYEVYKSDVIDMKNGSKTAEEAERAAHTLIYTMIKSPDLSDKELQKELGCEEPTDIIPLIFTEGEQLDLLDVALIGTGMQKGVVEEVKN